MKKDSQEDTQPKLWAEIRLFGFSPEGDTCLPLVRNPPDRGDKIQYSNIHHGTHRTHGMKTREWRLGSTYPLFPCIPCIPWLKKSVVEKIRG